MNRSKAFRFLTLMNLLNSIPQFGIQRNRRVEHADRALNGIVSVSQLGRGSYRFKMPNNRHRKIERFRRMIKRGKNTVVTGI